MAEPSKYTARKKGKLVKKSLRLFDGDTETIDEFYPKAGHSVIIRAVVHNFVKKLQENINQKELPNELRELANSVSLDGGGEEQPE